MNYNILIVDDLIKLCKIMVKDFELVGHNAIYATNGASAINILQTSNIDVVLLDLKLGAEDGIEILKKIKSDNPHLPVIMMTAHGSIANAVTAIKSGAYDYIQKPVNFEKIIIMIENAVNLVLLKEENAVLKQKLNNKYSTHFLTADPATAESLENLKKFAETDFPILITGESGTGKELIAEFIHQKSTRKDRDIYKINCAAFSETLLDDELFGHYKGAYTGADSDFKGVFERADGATLFLDEIGDMPSSIQAKILRTLQNREVKRLGGNKNIEIDIRFIAATNKNIDDMLRSGDFREDLFFRINTFQFTIPPLRYRKDDILMLANHFIMETEPSNIQNKKILDPSVKDFFNNYNWPGNVRELRNVINYATTICKNEVIYLTDLPNYLMKTHNKFPIKISKSKESEKMQLIETLTKCNYNKTKAAEQLKISRQSLYNKMKRFGMNG